MIIVLVGDEDATHRWQVFQADPDRLVGAERRGRRVPGVEENARLGEVDDGRGMDDARDAEVGVGRVIRSRACDGRRVAGGDAETECHEHDQQAYGRQHAGRLSMTKRARRKTRLAEAIATALSPAKLPEPLVQHDCRGIGQVQAANLRALHGNRAGPLGVLREQVLG